MYEYEILYDLSKSRFRSSFHLKKNDLDYIDSIGFDTLKKHAKEIIINRLAKYDEIKDGKQTPMKNHPVFIAQHATATCCRKCLEKWHKINKYKTLDDIEINYIVNIIIEWILIEYRKNRKMS